MLSLGVLVADAGARAEEQQRPPTLHIPKSRSIPLSPASSTSSLTDAQRRASKTRRSGDELGGIIAEEGLEEFTRSPILSPNLQSGLGRIRQHPPPPLRNPSSPHLTASQPRSPQLSPLPSRKSSLAGLSQSFNTSQSPILQYSEDLTRFPSESLHSFSFAHQSASDLHTRQNVLKRSIDFMRDKLSWATANPRLASAQARLAGDEEMLNMIELLQKANMKGFEDVGAAAGGGGGLSVGTAGLGIDRGPLTGPALTGDDNVFEKSFLPKEPEEATITEEPEESDVMLSAKSLSPKSEGSKASSHEPGPPLERTKSDDATQPPQRSPKSNFKRTYTDMGGYQLQHMLSEAMAKPFHASQSPSNALRTPPSQNNVPSFRAPALTRSTTALDNNRAPHGHRNNQAQAIFTTEAEAPWTITAANDLACLVFGVSRAEVRKLGIMEVIAESRRQWLEDRLKDPDQQAESVSQTSGNSKAGKASPPPSGLGSQMGNGITAKLLSKAPAPSRWSSAARRAQTDPTPPSMSPKAKVDSHHPATKSRGVLLCGDVVPIRKLNGATGSASLWVKEKSSGLIWVLEEIAEDVAHLTLDEIGSVVRGDGDVHAIWGLERVRRGMDVTRLVPRFPRMKGTNTGAIDFDELAKLRYFTAKTSNSIDIPITIEKQENAKAERQGQSEWRISSFPHIAGILVLDPAKMKIRSSNSVFSSALFGHANADGMPITDLIPSFDSIISIITDEDDIPLEDGIVIPEHSFRRARAVLALREGSADVAAAAMFMKPSGVPARHRDGSEIMVDVQMRVVMSESDFSHPAIAEEDAGGRRGSIGGVVYALWITYSRQLHAVNHGIGPVTPMMSRPGTPPHQPQPGAAGAHVDSATPSPQVRGAAKSIDDDDVRTHLLRDTLNTSTNNNDPDSRPTTSDSTTAPPNTNAEINPANAADMSSLDLSEPYEHPSAEMVAAGCASTNQKKKRIDDFVILEEMGQGAYGQVKLARYKKSAAKKMVIKYVTKRRILVDTWHRDRRLGTVPLEIHVLDYLRRDGLQHPNIVTMADFFEDDVNYYIEMIPHGLPGMDLFDYIELRVSMSESECRAIFRQVAAALEHLHVRAKVVHRDIKDENVILDGEGRVKVVDFGSAAYVKSGPFDVFVGTIDYAAPEVLRGLPYRGKEQDVWALGILLYTIVYKENPFYSIDEIMDHDLRVPYVMSEDCIDLIRRMLERDVEARIGIQGVLDHPWTRAEGVEDEEGEVGVGGVGGLGDGVGGGEKADGEEEKSEKAEKAEAKV